MSFAYMPMFTGDYLRDTRHLTPLKHGIYLLLLMHCWDQKGPVPLDEQECAGIANCRSADEIESLRYILNRYFVRMDDGWYNQRMQKEIERSETISHARSEAGRRGYEAKAKNLPGKKQAIAKQLPDTCSAPAKQVPLTPSPSLTPAPDQKETASPEPRAEARASRFALAQLPDDWASFCKTVRPDLNPARVFDDFRDHWIAKPGKEGRKLDWFATWRKWVRNEKAGAPSHGTMSLDDLWGDNGGKP